MKELMALCVVVAGVLMLRQGGFNSAWDVWMATGDVCALATGAWLGWVIHSRVLRRKRWQEMGSFVGSPFSLLFALLLVAYVIFNWNLNRSNPDATLQPRARVANLWQDSHVFSV